MVWLNLSPGLQRIVCAGQWFALEGFFPHCSACICKGSSKKCAWPWAQKVLRCVSLGQGEFLATGWAGESSLESIQACKGRWEGEECCCELCDVTQHSHEGHKSQWYTREGLKAAPRRGESNETAWRGHPNYASASIPGLCGNAQPHMAPVRNYPHITHGETGMKRLRSRFQSLLLTTRLET